MIEQYESIAASYGEDYEKRAAADDAEIQARADGQE